MHWLYLKGAEKGPGWADQVGGIFARTWQRTAGTCSKEFSRMRMQPANSDFLNLHWCPHPQVLHCYRASCDRQAAVVLGGH